MLLVRRLRELVLPRPRAVALARNAGARDHARAQRGTRLTKALNGRADLIFTRETARLLGTDIPVISTGRCCTVELSPTRRPVNVGGRRALSTVPLTPVS